jgi:glutamate dehydrogenase/leucine dehydrogenase
MPQRGLEPPRASGYDAPAGRRAAPFTPERSVMEELIFHEIADEYGPEKVVYVYEPRCGLRGIVVIDNTAAGPAIGGIRMASDLTTSEVFRLARAMTWKNALAGLPHGGGKSGILADPSAPNKEALIRQFARGIEALVGYIPGPDIGTDEVAMAWVRDEIGRSVGLSKVLGGIPLDQIGATGFGLAVCAEVAQDFCDLRLDGAKVVVQGYGNVGSHCARYLAERGAVLVGASDVDGTVFDPDGIDIEELVVVKHETGRVTDYPRGQKLAREAFVDMPCDILVPAARPDALTEANVDRLSCKMVLQGANIAVTPAADRILHQRGILSVPDFVANAGGVICASVEYHGGTQRRAFEAIDEKIRENTRAVLERAKSREEMPATAALALARQRVGEAMAYRRAG